jgi:probable phosphoglycerate mutase
VTLVAFIRHGQTDWNRDDRMQGSSDIPLNDTGRAQALDAVEVLRHAAWDVVVSSPLVRARETAEIIANALDLELGDSYAEFVERDYGPFEGENATACIARFPGKDYPGAEPISSVVERGLTGLARVAAEHSGRNVVIVCHGTIIRYTLATLARHPVDGINNGTVSELERTADGWRVLTVNGHPVMAADEPIHGETENA